VPLIFHSAATPAVSIGNKAMRTDEMMNNDADMNSGLGSGGVSLTKHSTKKEGSSRIRAGLRPKRLDQRSTEATDAVKGRADAVASAAMRTVGVI